MARKIVIIALLSTLLISLGKTYYNPSKVNEGKPFVNLFGFAFPVKESKVEKLVPYLKTFAKEGDSLLGNVYYDGKFYRLRSYRLAYELFADEAYIGSVAMDLFVTSSYIYFTANVLKFLVLEVVSSVYRRRLRRKVSTSKESEYVV